jgi:hypothetical protein
MPTRHTTAQLRTAVERFARAVLIASLLATLVTPIIAQTSGQPTANVELTPAFEEDPTPRDPAGRRQATAAGPRQPSNETYHAMCRHYGENGFTIRESAALFSRDRDQLTADTEFTREDYIEACGHESTWATNRTLNFDFTSAQAFPEVERWNERDISDIPFPEARRDQSLHPKGAQTVDAGHIKDGAASVYSVSPSVALRDERRGGTTLLIRDKTTIQGAQSYRLEFTPEIDDSGRRRVSRTISSQRIGTTCLIDQPLASQAGQKQTTANDTLCQSHTPLAAEASTPGSSNAKARRTSNLTFTYRTGLNETLSYVATIRYTITRLETVCSDWNSSTNNCDGIFWPVSWNQTTHYTSAVDELDVRYYSQPTPTAEVARYPDGDTEFVLEGRDMYGYRLGWDALFSEVRWPQNDLKAGWAWRVFSARRPAWSYLVNETATTRSVSESPTHPLQNYAFPVAASTTDTSGTGLAAHGDIQVAGIVRSSSPIRTPSIDDRILVSAPQPQYRLPYAVRYRAGEDLNFADARVVGLLNGTNTTGVYVDREVQLRETNLTADITDTGSNDLRVNITLRKILETSRGIVSRALSTTDSRAYVTVNGQRVQTDEAGTATVVVDDAAYVKVEYRPVDWISHRRDESYLASSRWFRTETKSNGFVLQLLVELTILFFPFVLVLLTLRSIARQNPTTNA